MCMKFFRHEHFIDALTQSTSEGSVLSNDFSVFHREVRSVLVFLNRGFSMILEIRHKIIIFMEELEYCYKTLFVRIFKNITVKHE